MQKRAKWKWILCIAALILGCWMTGTQEIRAEQGRGVIAFGADLSPEQRAVVLELFGITEEELQDFQVITVSHEQEKNILGKYLDDTVIGNRSLSCVMLKPGREGSGVDVATRNINYCTAGMYRNALLTAGVKDVDMIVAAPAKMSGTAALIGAVQAYAQMEGKEIREDVIETALQEMLVTGAVAEAVRNVDHEEVEGLIAYVKEKVAGGGLDSEEEIRTAIREGESYFGISLGEENIRELLKLMDHLKGMGLDSAYLISQAEQIYQKYGEELLKYADEAVHGVMDYALGTEESGELNPGLFHGNQFAEDQGVKDIEAGFGENSDQNGTGKKSSTGNPLWEFVWRLGTETEWQMEDLWKSVIQSWTNLFK